MDLEALHDQLQHRAFLHDDPAAYLAGVDDALDVMVEPLVQVWESEEALGA